MGYLDERSAENSTGSVAAARDATYWAKAVSRLNVSEVPEGALNLNVTGKQLAGPIQGFGKMWQKTYQVRLPQERVSATDLIATWKKRFPDFWPEGNRFYAPLTGIEPGEVALLNMTLPGRVKLSTGVLVLYADEESFTLMTPQGHMFAGWITFSATERDGETVSQAQAQVLMRASDPIFELGLTLGGHRQEDLFWSHTLREVAAHFGEAAVVDTQVVCVDKRRQWSRWSNVWHSSAIRSAGYMLGTPIRGARALAHRGQTPGCARPRHHEHVPNEAAQRAAHSTDAEVPKVHLHAQEPPSTGTAGDCRSGDRARPGRQCGGPAGDPRHLPRQERHHHLRPKQPRRLRHRLHEARRQSPPPAGQVATRGYQHLLRLVAGRTQPRLRQRPHGQCRDLPAPTRWRDSPVDGQPWP